MSDALVWILAGAISSIIITVVTFVLFTFMFYSLGQWMERKEKENENRKHEN